MHSSDLLREAVQKILYDVTRLLPEEAGRQMRWNCVFNPITVLIDDHVATALVHPELTGVIRQIVGEVAAVAATLKVPLSLDMPERVVKATL